MFSLKINNNVNEIFNFLDKTNKTISFGNCWWGLTLLTMIPGASKVFLGSIVSYSTYSKQQLLNIDKSDVDKYSAVSERIVMAMAENVKKQLKSDYSISVTGNAGPSTDGKNQKL